MRKALTIAALAAALSGPTLSGCFTDVGNAEGENKIKADFGIDYARNPILPKPAAPAGAANWDTVRIDHFYLSVWEAEIRTVGGGESRIWKQSDSGIFVDFTGKDAMGALPPETFARDSLLSFLLECTIPTPPAQDPAALDITTFRRKGYIRGVYRLGADSIPFLFALPKTNYLHLRYSRGALEGWKTGNTYAVKIVFYGLKWITGAGLLGAQVSLDSKGRRMILIDPTHNAALHRLLSTRFFQSFNTADIEKG